MHPGETVIVKMKTGKKKKRKMLRNSETNWKVNLAPLVKIRKKDRVTIYQP